MAMHARSMGTFGACVRNSISAAIASRQWLALVVCSSDLQTMLTSARGRSILVAACVILTVLALIVSSLSIRVFLAALVLLSAAVLVTISLINRRHETNTSTQNPHLMQSPESLGVGSLFEATMGSMRRSEERRVGKECRDGGGGWRGREDRRGGEQG